MTFVITIEGQEKHWKNNFYTNVSKLIHFQEELQIIKSIKKPENSDNHVISFLEKNCEFFKH